jgi:hypothetical protein
MQVYSDCTVSFPKYIGDNVCHGGDYNTAKCGFDGGDCRDFNAKYPNCTVLYPSSIGDGYCHGGAYNTAGCGFDGDDCEDFNAKYPNCTISYPSWIGDGDCDSGDYKPGTTDWNEFGYYNTTECGFDGGDCTSGTSKYVSWNASLQTITFIFSTVLWLY